MSIFKTDREQHECEDDLADARAQIAELTRERDEAKRKLFPYADDTEIGGMGWSDFYLIGNRKSISELQRVVHRSAQLEEYQKAFDNRRAELERERDEISAAIGSVEYMDPPDGGDVSLGEQVRRMRAERNALRERLAEAETALRITHDLLIPSQQHWSASDWNVYNLRRAYFTKHGA